MHRWLPSFCFVCALFLWGQEIPQKTSNATFLTSILQLTACKAEKQKPRWMLKERIMQISGERKTSHSWNTVRHTPASLLLCLTLQVWKSEGKKKKAAFFKAQKASLLSDFRSTSLFSTVEIIASIVQVLPSYKGKKKKVERMRKWWESGIKVYGVTWQWTGHFETNVKGWLHSNTVCTIAKVRSWAQQVENCSIKKFAS